MSKEKIGNLPDWTIFFMPEGRPAIIRRDLGGNKGQSVIQFSDKTSSTISKFESVEVFALPHELIYKNLAELERAHFVNAQANPRLQLTANSAATEA